MSTFYKSLLTASMGLVGLNGCVYGYIYDSASGSAVEGVAVIVASGTCSGTGCGTGLPTQSTDSSGLYVFDAYGNRHGENNVQLITAASGEEAVRLVYSRAGYRSVTVYHRPKYSTMTYDGADYEVSAVQPVYLCALNAVDTDGDGVCDAAEARYGTNPNSSDTDGDRISDFAELYGYGGVDLRYWGADPRKKDVFVEVDYYADRKPTQAALDRVTTSFANAPVSNPNGTTGIALHLVLDSQIAAADADTDLTPVWTDFDVIKAKYFKSRRAPFFHYALFANTYSGGTSSGISRGIPAHDFVVTLGGWPVAGGTELQQAGTLMHELGHNIGLRHGGNDDSNYKANYLSQMNYEYQMFGLRMDGVDNVLDYSRVRVAAISEASVNEVSAFAPVAPTTEADLAHIGVRINGVQRAGTASANLDFNGDGVIQTASYAYSLNRDADTTDLIPAAQHDWLALVYDGAGQIGDGWLGTSQGLSRQQPFFVLPEKTESCLTVEMSRAR
ncbi:hypothetical protein HI113_05445 [Corallococcus exiguus]|uniref:hypothetical protein n=1 Tax=Corallococcus TaxID=83461 RepID=UPI000ECAB72B|nr:MULTISPECIES: hypothetical protein [Corallococcus]NNB85144.1 hypothetical protein [Corallococcus exiguus]NNB93353.1 hypothetical protein [Corallococcus exiguus]NPC47340.1 hypothetical protein [Corallococcus exiguus]RKH84191.1 hypothetical protein D7X99_10500 [Corallococcus sp. AB032C]